MDEYIKRKAAIKAIYESDPFGVHKYFGWRAMDIEEALRAIPAADVAPVRNGEWLLRHEGYGHYWECSVCHTNPCIYVTKDTKFCPNCGARMDGAE